jgi:aminoglycoside/choline kinase family phosphotransferase
MEVGPLNHKKHHPSGFLNFLSESLNSNDFEVIPLAGDASTRLYYRIVVNEKSFVLMSWEPFAESEDYPFLSVLYHFQRHQIHVPQVIAQKPELGLILLEDLGDLTLERKFWESQNQMNALPFYFQAIDELIKIHYPATVDRSDCTAFSIEFDTEKLLWEMNYGREHLIEKLAGISLTTEQNNKLSQEFESICKTLAYEPKVICHRDYHSRNLMLKLGKMRVIDFQDARLGPIQYDLVSLVEDSYVDLSEESKAAILLDYREKASKLKHDLASKEQFEAILNLQILQRCFKACGSFSSFFNTREDLRYLNYIQPTLKRIVSVLSGLKEEFPAFYSVLTEHGLIDREFDKECTP